MHNFFAKMCSNKILSLTLNVNFENVFLQKNLNSKITKNLFFIKNFEHDHFKSIKNFNLPFFFRFTYKIILNKILFKAVFSDKLSKHVKHDHIKVL